MKYWYDEKMKCTCCEPNSADEWLEFIWEIGVDYDGYEKSENLKELIDELVDASKKARACLREGKIFYDNPSSSKSLSEAEEVRDMQCVNKQGYCPLCDKVIEKKTDQEHTYCPYCGHRIGLKRKFENSSDF